MTAPRQVLPGTTYLVTRRCAQRQHLLRPSEGCNRVFGYVLAVAARRFGMQVHAFCVLSNHFHLVVTDPDARLPAFEQYLASLVARALNAALGRWESFWGPPSYSAVELLGAADVVDKVAYTLANPVAAGLVRRGRDWPGLWSSPTGIGALPRRFRRPARFFRSGGSMPDTALLEVVPPPGFESAEAFRARLEPAVARREDQAAARLAAAGRDFLGVAKVLASRPDTRSETWEPRRALRPRVAGLARRARTEALLRLAAFVSKYRLAWRARRAGLNGVWFPAGTYLLRIMHGVPCAAPG